MEEFLEWLFGDAVSADQRIALFTVPEKRSRFFDEIRGAATVAGNLSQTQNVYFGVGLIHGSPSGRGKRDDVGGIGAFWADVDFASPAHAGKSLPANSEDCDRLLAELPLPPSVVVDSGHGRHLYWLLHEPWLFQDAGERDHAAHLAHGWHGLVCAVAARLGWSLENLGDLTRILRLPGTVNRKQPETPLSVQILSADQHRRYSIDDFENFIPAATPDPPPDSPRTSAAAAVPVDLDAQPPADKFQSAMEESPAFRQTWERCRPDLLDQSASAYDLSLATLAVIRGWTTTTGVSTPGNERRDRHMNIAVHRDICPAPDFWPADESKHPSHSSLYVRDKRGLRMAKRVSRFSPRSLGQKGQKVAVSPCATAFVLLSFWPGGLGKRRIIPPSPLLSLCPCPRA